MDWILYMISYIISTAIVFYFIYRLYQLYVGNEKIDQFVRHYYVEKGLTVLNITGLLLKEKIRYGVPVSIFQFYHYCFGFISGKFNYVRKIEVEGQDDTQLLVYIELQVRNREIISIKEFDKYDL